MNNDVLISKLIKLLMLTTSDNDNESLLSIRKANIILKKNNYTWESVLKSSLKDPFSSKESEDIGNLEMCEYLLHSDWIELSDWELDFLISIHERLEDENSLTEKQDSCLKKIYKKYRF